MQDTCLDDDRVIACRSVIPEHILDLERLFVSRVDAIKVLIVCKDGAMDRAMGNVGQLHYAVIGPGSVLTDPRAVPREA